MVAACWKSTERHRIQANLLFVLGAAHGTFCDARSSRLEGCYMDATTGSITGCRDVAYSGVHGSAILSGAFAHVESVEGEADAAAEIRKRSAAVGVVGGGEETNELEPNEFEESREMKEDDSSFQAHHCANPYLIERASFHFKATASLCAEYCRQTAACSFFTVNDQTCGAISTCGQSVDGHDSLLAYQLDEAPFRCVWDETQLGHRLAGAMAKAASLAGADLQRHLLTLAVDFTQEPSFGGCPIGGAAVRLLHVWAAASYHHGLPPKLAFVTESNELTFHPELRLVLDVDWVGILTTPWSAPFFMVLSRLSKVLCARLKSFDVSLSCAARPSIEASPNSVCNLNAAADLLESTGSLPDLSIFRRAQQLTAGCSSKGRLSDLLKAAGAARIFSVLASFAAKPRSTKSSSDVVDDVAAIRVGEAQALQFSVVAVRSEVVTDRIAAIGLASSLRAASDSASPRGPLSIRSGSAVEVLVFVERLESIGYKSGFFNVVTENKCEMDFLSHFHRVFCVFLRRDGHHIVPAVMSSGLLAHPPFGPTSWSCKLPKDVKYGNHFSLWLLEPALWERPLELELRMPTSQNAGKAYGFAACPQPLYRLEMHGNLLRDWLMYHRNVGVEHWTIYDLDGSGGEALALEHDVDLITRLPEALGSPLLKAGNAWNPICLEAIAQSQCVWRYRGRARWVLSIHSFDEYLVSPRHRERALETFERQVLAPLAPHVAVFRLPAVNYGGVPETLPDDVALVAKFKQHTGKLYWHVVVANPSAVVSVNTTNARLVPPLGYHQYFSPEDLRVNHYVDALGARQNTAGVTHFSYLDTSLEWAAIYLARLRASRVSGLEEQVDALLLPAAALARQAVLFNMGCNHSSDKATIDGLSDMFRSSSAALSPVTRVALEFADDAQLRQFRVGMEVAFHDGDVDKDGYLSQLELRQLAFPKGWDGHLRRRDLHALGVYLHAWLASEADWDARSFLAFIDRSPTDERVSSQEWYEGVVRFSKRREALLAAQMLHDQAEAIALAKTK